MHVDPSRHLHLASCEVKSNPTTPNHPGIQMNLRLKIRRGIASLVTLVQKIRVIFPKKRKKRKSERSCSDSTREKERKIVFTTISLARSTPVANSAVQRRSRASIKPWSGRRIWTWCWCPWDWGWWPPTTCGSSIPSSATPPAPSSASTPSPASAGSPPSWPSNTEKNGVLAVQTLRNNIMASTVLATTAITLVSLISVFIGATAGGRSPAAPSSSSSPQPLLVYGSKTGQVFAVKYLAISLCFMLAFVCNVQAIRLYAHASFLLGLPPAPGGEVEEEFAAYVARTVNRGSHAWSLGLRAFYVSLALFLWTFGPIPMLVCSVVMCALLYFLDTTRDYAKGIHVHMHGERGSAQKDSTV